MSRTRIVQLKPGQRRDAAINAQTIVLSGEALAFAETFKDAFLAHYARIRSTLEEYRRPGIAMIAVDDEGVAGTACVAAKKKQLNVAIIGRHGMADLFLDGDPSLSLRHLVVLIHPLGRDDEPRIRIVDLRTPTAFLDEHGNQMEAVEAEGPLLVRVGRFRVFCFPTGDDQGPWPDDPQQGWECIPERVYLYNVPAEPDRWARRRLRGRGDTGEGEPLEGPLEAPPTDHEVSVARFRAAAAGEIDNAAAKDEEMTPKPELDEDQRSSSARDPMRRTIVQSISGPSRARRSLLAEGETPAGAIRIRSDSGKSTIIIGRRALNEGVLFGRYERCDNDGLEVLSNGRISRVHLLLIEIAGSVYAIDSASTNGMWQDGKEHRVIKLSLGSRLMLGDKLATLEWLRAR